jgi:hypothetical protein
MSGVRTGLATVLVASALTAGPSGARADGASPWVPAPVRSSAVGSATGVPPLRLLRPIATDTVDRALREAEGLYRGRQHAAALHAYGTLVEMDPSLARAWLRLGNLHQQAGRDEEALDAYRQAALGPGAASRDMEARGKALLNIALLGVAQASRAIDELDALDAESLDEARDAVARQVGAQRRRTTRAATLWTEGEAARAAATAPGGPVTAASPSGAIGGAAPVAVPPARPAPVAVPAPVSRTGAEGAESVEPYTVDRWISTPRRTTARRDVGRGRLSEPVVETPLPPLPTVETYRGLQPGMRP